MIFREATINDIEQILEVRFSVKENQLSDPSSVSNEDCIEYLTTRGKGWVCEIDDVIVGFSIIDIKENNVWALFVRPKAEGRGIGRRLHDMMMDWFFGQNKKWAWLGTSPGTRAATFYKKSGWIETGKHGDDEIKFELKAEDWFNKNK